MNDDNDAVDGGINQCSEQGSRGAKWWSEGGSQDIPFNSIAINFAQLRTQSHLITLERPQLEAGSNNEINNISSSSSREGAGDALAKCLWL